MAPVESGGSSWNRMELQMVQARHPRVPRVSLCTFCIQLVLEGAVLLQYHIISLGFGPCLCDT